MSPSKTQSTERDHASLGEPQIQVTTGAGIQVRIASEAHTMTPAPLVPATLRGLQGEVEQWIDVPIGGASVPCAVAPGTYLLEVVLPSGETLRATVRAKADSTVQAVLKPSTSPHEWLAFQRLWKAHDRLEPARKTPSAKEALLPEISELRLVGKPGPGGWTGWTAVASLSTVPSTAETPGERLLPLQSDEKVQHYIINGTSVEQGAALFARFSDGLCSVPLPLPWRTSDGQWSNLDVVIQSDRRLVSSSIMDSRFAPVVAYLGSGHSALAARLLGDLPKQLLYDKIENPFSAAAGAYVLVQQLTTGEREAGEWRQWVVNLANWFPTLPDGAILAGAIELELNQRKPNESALKWFLTAAERGTPLFSIGIRMLADGLLAFAGSKGPWLLTDLFNNALRATRMRAMRADPREPLTTIRVPVTS